MMTFQRPLSMVARRRSTLGNIPTLPGCSKRRKPPSFIRGTILEAGSSIICGKAGSINKLSPEKPSATAHGGDDHIITLPTHPPASFPDNKILGLFDPASVCRIKLQLVAVLLEKGFEFDVATRVVQTEYHNASSLLAAGSDQPGWHSMMDHMTKCLRRMMEGPSQISVPYRASIVTPFSVEDNVIRSGVERVQRYALEDRRGSDPHDLLEQHYRLVMHYLQRLSSCVLGELRHIPMSIHYAINPSLIRRFRAREVALKGASCLPQEDKKKFEYVYAFHGTTLTNANQIIDQNFSLDRIGQTTGLKGNYGAGIYFSDFADISLKYGRELLLCRLLPGRSFDTGEAMLGSRLEAGYDSHRIHKYQTGRAQEIVIFDVDQILPCYLIRFGPPGP